VDLNGDSFPDLVATRVANNYTPDVFLNDGTGKFTRSTLEGIPADGIYVVISKGFRQPMRIVNVRFRNSLDANRNGICSLAVQAYERPAAPDQIQINAGLNDAWYFPDTSGQGFFITVFPDLGYVSLAWFTYDTALPPLDATANLGDPGHRWLTAVGPFDGNQALMDIEMTSGGIFDTPSVITSTDPPGSDGTILLTFDSCNSGTVEYDIPSINRQGIVPIQRVANDNIALCEVLDAD
jgi:hypothetical protein